MSEAQPNANPGDSSKKSSKAGRSSKVIRPGTLVGGRYEIARAIGQGGFGVSYLAEDSQRFGELCVVKEFKPRGARDKASLVEKAKKLFEREARVLYRIDHPQIPKLMAFFVQAGRLFIVQEYVDGVTYIKLLQERRQQNQAFFTEGELLSWFSQILPVLGYLHDLGILHRDISPDNIMLSRQQGLPVLIDFGMVNDPSFDSLLEADVPKEAGPPASDRTVAGKFGYSPPEQLQFGRCSAASDLYALGVTAIVLLTGKSPRDLISPQTMEWCWQEFAAIGPDLTAILTRMIRQKPQERYQSVREVARALRDLPTAPGSVSWEPELQSARPAPSGATESAGAPARQLDPEFIGRCEDELRRCIGPMAGITIHEALEENPTATEQELIEALAGQIANADLAAAFVSHLGATTNQPNPVGGSLSEDVLACCRRALARSIGPLGSIILDEILTDCPHLTSAVLVERLAAEISDERAVAAFRAEFSLCSSTLQ